MSFLKKNPDSEQNMNILEHLGELRDRMIYSIVFLVMGCLVGAFFADGVIGILFRPFTQMDIRREEKVLRLRFGIGGGFSRTLEEVGTIFNVTRERVRQIETKALNKLRHPSRRKNLIEFME